MLSIDKYYQIVLIQTFKRYMSSKTENILNCKGPTLRIYSQYYNHNLNDYLITLHNKRISLSIDEITYIMKSLTHAMISFQKMKIKTTKITMKKIFISLDGELMLSPLITLFNTQIEQNHENINCIPLFPKQKKISLKQYVYTQYNEKQNLMDIFLQLTSYMVPHQFSSSQHIYLMIQNCQSLNQLYEKLPNSQYQGLLTSRLYNQNLSTQKNSEDIQK